MAPTTRAAARALRGTKFSHLPAEIRVKIWRETLSYGMYYVNFTSKNCPADRLATLNELIELGADYDILERDPLLQRLLKPILLLDLELPRRKGLPSAFVNRVRITQTLLKTCSESRFEVLKFYPHAVSSPAGDLRFHGKKDVVCVLNIFKVKNWWDMILERNRWNFPGDWNLIIERLAVDTSARLAFGPSVGIPDDMPGNMDHHVWGYVQTLLLSLPKVEECFLNSSHAFGLANLADLQNLPVKKRRCVIGALGKVFTSGLSASFMVKSGLRHSRLIRWDAQDPTDLRHHTNTAQTHWDFRRYLGATPGSPLLDRLRRGLICRPMCDVDEELAGFCKQIDFQ